MSRNIWIGIVVVAVLVAGGWWYFNQSSVPATSETNLLPATQQNVSPVADDVEEALVLVYFGANVSAQEKIAYARTLENHPSVLSAEYVSPTQMRDEYRARHGGDPRDAGNTDPFPGMVRVTAKNPSLRSGIAEYIKANTEDTFVPYIDW